MRRNLQSSNDTASLGSDILDAAHQMAYSALYNTLPGENEMTFNGSAIQVLAHRETVSNDTAPCANSGSFNLSQTTDTLNSAGVTNIDCQYVSVSPLLFHSDNLHGEVITLEVNEATEVSDSQQALEREAQGNTCYVHSSFLEFIFFVFCERK